MNGQRTLTASPEVSHSMSTPCCPHGCPTLTASLVVSLSRGRVSALSPRPSDPRYYRGISLDGSLSRALSLGSYPDPARTISRSPLAHLTPLRRRRRSETRTRSQTCRSRGKVTAHGTPNNQQMHARWPGGDPPCSLLCLLVPTLPGHPAKSYSFRGSCSSYCSAIKIKSTAAQPTYICVLSGDLPPHTL